jgi:hypothetical protein
VPLNDAPANSKSYTRTTILLLASASEYLEDLVKILRIDPHPSSLTENK